MRDDCRNAYRTTVASLKKTGKIDYELFLDLFYISKHGLVYDEGSKNEYKYYTDYVKEIALDQVTEDESMKERWRSLYWETLKLESFYFFESFLLYMEHKRPYEKRFYEPRAKTLKTVVDDLQELEDNPKQILYALSLPARTGKSTLILFFKVWHVLRHPLSHNAMGTHSGMLADHFYKEDLELFTSEEYCFEELYAYFHPDMKFIEDKSAEKMTISFGTKGDFPTITCRGIDGTWTGAIDISGGKDFGFLLVDDLVRDRTHSLSPKRMNDTFAEFLNKMVDRMNDGAKMLLIGTLWNVMDPIKRLEDMYANDDRYVFRRIPALNENDESNFDYEVKGFSTQYYKEMRDRLVRAGNEAEWFAKYQQAPYVREGQLFAPDSLRWFNGILTPDHQYNLVVVCDVALGGGDSVSMPIGLRDTTTDWTYIVDWYFSSAGVTVTVPGVADMIMKHGVMDVTFERNAGGLLYAQKVSDELKSRGYICNCNTKPAPNNIAKEDKIKGCEGEIKSKVIFLDETRQNANELEGVKVYNRTVMYQRAIEEMETFVTIGKNEHDDAADSIAQLTIKAYGMFGNAEVVMLDRAMLGF